METLYVKNSKTLFIEILDIQTLYLEIFKLQREKKDKHLLRHGAIYTALFCETSMFDVACFSPKSACTRKKEIRSRPKEVNRCIHPCGL